MYKAVLFTLDGSEYVSDFERDTIEEVWECICNMGSKWFFYPVVVVVENNTYLSTKGMEVVSCEPFSHQIGLRVEQFAGWLYENQDLVAGMLGIE